MNKKIISGLLTCSMMMSLIPAVAFSAAEESNPDKTNWFAYEQAKAADVRGTILDVSDLLDAPAGKHGFLTTSEGDNFYFEDGTEARFWGINITYPIMPHENAVEAAERIAQSGYNLVRLHLIDYGPLWGAKDDGQRYMKEDSLDKLCFFISELKKRGIYVMIDMVISTPNVSDFPESFDIENSGIKIYSYFDEAKKEFTKKYARDLMSYYNKYTGMCLKDDPAVVLIDLKNEDSIGCTDTLGSQTAKQLEKKYNEWLMEKYGTTENLETVWGSSKNNQNAILDDDESLEDGTIKLYGDIFASPARRSSRVNDNINFRAQVMEEYFDECIEDLRNIGVKCMITGSTSWSSNGIELNSFYANRNTDFTDIHVYTTMPTEGGSAYIDGQKIKNKARSIFEEGDSDKIDAGIIGQISKRRVAGNPLTISEWNDVAPNKFRSETLMFMSAYGALQGWNPIGFSWRHKSTDITVTTDNAMKSPFGMADNPEYLGSMPAAAMTFYNGIAETESEFFYMRYQDNEPFGSQYLSSGDNATYMGLIGKTGIAFDNAYDEDMYDNDILQLTKEALADDMNFVSITGELSMDYTNKMFRMNAEKVQGISGFTQEAAAVELDDVIFDIDNYFATAYLNARDNKPIYDSEKLLLTVVGDTQQTGQVNAEDDYYGEIVTAGTGPILVEPITGTVTIKSSTPITVEALSSAGKATKTIATTAVSGGYSFTMSADDKAMHYQITKTAGTKNTHISLGNSTTDDVFTDITSGAANETEIERVALMNYMVTTLGGEFKPDDNVLRKDMIYGILNSTRVDPWISSTAASYADLSNTDTYFKSMCKAVTLGVITPESNYVYPDNEVTREEAVVWIAKTLGDGGFWPSMRTKQPDASFSLSQFSDYSSANLSTELEGYCKRVFGLGYMSAKDGKLALGDKITRREAAQIIYNLAWK